MSTSYLFVPGTRADRFAKACAAGADRVIIDLEDAVSVADKSMAREQVCEAILSGLPAPVLVRVNAEGTPWFRDDLVRLAQASSAAPGSLGGIVVPKLESPETVARVRETLNLGDRTELIGLIESAVGVQRIEQLAASGVTRFAVGALDLSVDIGADVESPVLDATYVRLVVASRAAGILSPLGSPPVSIHAAAEIEASGRRLKGMGVGGQLCIHPAQVTAVIAGFAPTASQIEWARRILASDGAAVQVDGQMVDKPVRDRAEQVLAAIERSES